LKALTLFDDRSPRLRHTFHALSWSFVDHLVERDGLPALRELADGPQHIAVRKQECLLRLRLQRRQRRAY
jgi:hypothetical protein